MTVNEEWRPVVGYPQYDVSDLGNVRSWRGHNRSLGHFVLTSPRALTPWLAPDGYLKVTLKTALGKRKPGEPLRHSSRPIAHLVAAAFIGPRPTGLVVAHDNGIRTDNRASNLFYKTYAQNTADKLRHGTHQFGEKHPRAILTEEAVRDVRSSERLLDDLAAQYGVDRTTIWAAKHRNWKHVI